MNDERLGLEYAILKAHMPDGSFGFCMNSDPPYLWMNARTNRGNIYTLRVDLDEFPNSPPVVCVNQMLRKRNGEPMDHASTYMHTLTSPYKGKTRICHFGNSWTYNCTLWMIFLKCRVWLEMYELHLQTGNPILYYLKDDN